MIVHDTFTGSGNLVAHTGEIGATWALNTSFGPAASGELILASGVLRRPTFAEGGSSSTGEALAYVSGVASGDFYIQALVTFANTGDSAAISFYDKADQGGSARALVQLGSNVFPDGVNNLVVFNPGTSHAGAGFAISAGVQYTFRLEVSSANYTVFINGVQKAQIARTAAPVNQLGLSIYDSSGTAVISVDEFIVDSLVPPVFWTDFVGTSELQA